jgi:hypothetical protein
MYMGIATVYIGFMGRNTAPDTRRKVMDILVKDGNGFGATLSSEGQSVYYTKAAQIAPDLAIVGQVFGGFYNEQHCQIALDAGGTVVAGDASAPESVSVDSEALIAYCNRLRAARNPHAGMMQTSTGEWVMADDWDAIEDAH